MASRNNSSVSQKPNRRITERYSNTEEKKEDELHNHTMQRKGPTSSRVQFHQLTIREYPIEVGDNPGSFAGPSLSIGWKVVSEMKLSVEEYENKRPERRRGREMIVPSDMRFQRLRQAGFSRSEIVTATRPVNIVRTQRRRTRETLQLQTIQEINEKVGRKFLNVLTGGRKKKQANSIMEDHLRASDSSVSSTSTLPFERSSLPNIPLQVYKPVSNSKAPFRELLPTLSGSCSSSDSEMLA